jgi:tRNA(Ile)-lysidine synthase
LVNIDRFFKSKNHLITSNEKEELKQRKNIIVGRKFLVTFYKEYIFISPYKNETLKLPKSFKEKCRVLKIEPKLRSYLFLHAKVFKLFKTLAQEA